MILVIGDINLDIIVNLREKINFNTDSQSKIFFQEGGSAANFSYWTAGLGQKVRLIAKTGRDLSADYLEDEFKKSEVEFINLTSEKKDTGRIVILLNKTGQRTMLTDRGANITVNPMDIRDEYFENIDHLHIGGYSFFGGTNMEKTALKIIERAKNLGISISFDPSSYSELKNYGPKKILKQTQGLDFIFPNYEEGKILTNQEKPEEIVKILMKYYKFVVLKLGDKGCYIKSEQIQKFVKQPHEATGGDTTGAGDAFSAAFIVYYIKYKDFEKAAGYANQIAFKCVEQFGGHSFIKKKDPVLDRKLFDEKTQI